jgi:PEP-CTERM motif
MQTIARVLLPVLVLLLLVSSASAMTVAPDLVLIELNLNWTTIPWLPGGVTVSGSNLWQNGVGYPQGLAWDDPRLMLPSIPNWERWAVNGSTGGYFDLGWYGGPWFGGINLEAPLTGGRAPDRSFLFPAGYQHFVIGFGGPVLLPGDYAIDHAYFVNESGPFSTYGTWFADSGFIHVTAVPEPTMLLLLIGVGLVGLRRVMNRRARTVMAGRRGLVLLAWYFAVVGGTIGPFDALFDCEGVRVQYRADTRGWTSKCWETQK